MNPPFLLFLLASVVVTVAAEVLRLVSPPDLRLTHPDITYSIKDQYCWILAHTAVRVGEHVYIDGGMAKYRVMRDREPVGVCDLNGHTVKLSLEKDFDVDYPNLKLVAKKDPGVPVTTRGSLWVDGEDLLMQGGHFPDHPSWNTSIWYKNKTEIPGYEIWRFTPNKQPEEAWRRDSYHLEGDRNPIRTVSGAATCTDTKCFWFGGYTSSRTANDTPANYSLPQRGMLVYDIKTKTLQNETIDGYGTESDGYEFGTIDWIPGKDKKGGLLVSLMGVRSLMGRANTTDDDLDGEGVSFTYVMLYDLEGKRWYNQSTEYRGEPLTRTRFCTALVHDDERGVYDLFVYGGQQVGDVTTGVTDIYVLSMPAFKWVKLKPKGVSLMTQHLRSHACVTHGDQMVIIGGSWPSNREGEVDQDAMCMARLVNVLNLSKADGQYQANFNAKKTPYRQAERVSNEVPNATKPIVGGWVDERLETIWQSLPNNPLVSHVPRLPPGAIAGIVLGVLAVILACAGFFLWRRHINSSPPPLYRSGSTSTVMVEAPADLPK